MEVGLGEKVDAVRAKVGLGDTDLLNAWRTVNVRACHFDGYLFLSRSLSPLSSQTKAQEISHRMNGNVYSKQANTYSTIEELKAYFAEPKKGEDELARSKIVNALQVKGAAAWIVHNAVKRNKGKHRKGIASRFQNSLEGLLTIPKAQLDSANSQSGGGTRPSSGVDNARTTMWDPARDV